MPRKEASTVLSIGILCAALAFFWATARRQQTLVYLLKPTTTVLILLLASGGLAASPAPAYAWAVSVALLWSLLGDILLLFPARFVAGLAAFAVAQVAYAWGLWRLAPQALTPPLAWPWRPSAPFTSAAWPAACSGRVRRGCGPPWRST